MNKCIYLMKIAYCWCTVDTLTVWWHLLAICPIDNWNASNCPESGPEQRQLCGTESSICQPFILNSPYNAFDKCSSKPFMIPTSVETRAAIRELTLSNARFQCHVTFSTWMGVQQVFILGTYLSLRLLDCGGRSSALTVSVKICTLYMAVMSPCRYGSAPIH